jgi:plasmid stabilization system protein ParE
MTKIVVTHRAHADVAEILVHLTQAAGYPVAARYRQEFDAVYERLAALPESGPRRRTLGPHARIALVHPYVIVYDNVDDIVTVLRVLHARRNISRRLVRQTER